MNELDELKRLLGAVSDLQSVSYVLEWDQLTYLPKGGAEARGRQQGLIEKLLHEHRSAPRLAELVGSLSTLADEDTLDGAIVRRAARDVHRAQRVPSTLKEELTRHASSMYGAWVDARKNDDFASMRPLLEKNVELSLKYADCFDVSHPADAFIDEHDPGMTAAGVQQLFGEFREQLVPIVKTLTEAAQPDASFLGRHYPEDAQFTFTKAMAKAIGYDFDRGRQDLTAHPFMIRFAGGDVRITTRIKKDPTQAIFGTIHESGHALYEQGIAAELDGLPIGNGTSTGVHESQSRLWENIVGRSRAFWTTHFPALKDAFPDALVDVDLEMFHRAINRVRPSLIRVESDEVTYNLHVMMRFDLELAMLSGELKVADLPEAWNARMKADLGVTPPNDAEGCLQDVHWHCMPIGGAFQGYALGNMMSAQFYASAESAIPDLDGELTRGNCDPLRVWLTENIYQYGGRYTPEEIVLRATGKDLSPAPFIQYLKKKYGALYNVSF